MLLKHIHPKAWRSELPEGSGKKTTVSTFAHIHNCRLAWIKMTGKRTGLPASLDRHPCTKREAARALKKSAEALSRHIAAALERPDGRIKGFPLNAVAFLSYLVSHDAHHRGQVLLLSRQLGFRLPGAARYGVWHCGAPQIVAPAGAACLAGC